MEGHAADDARKIRIMLVFDHQVYIGLDQPIDLRCDIHRISFLDKDLFAIDPKKKDTDEEQNP